jgi:hypothetical protein
MTPETAGPRRSWAGRGELASSIVLIFPLFLTYQVGVMFTGHVNGADVVTRAAYSSLGRTTYLLVNAAIAIGFLLWLRSGRNESRRAALRLDVILPVVFEAAIYALTLGALVTLVLDRAFGLSLTGASIVNALGAGAHEELVFRLGVFGGLVALASRTSMQPRVVVMLALAASALAFSAAHHVGAHGEPFTNHAFAFRCLAGVVFGLVFWFRSLAHAVYAHALYDMLVYWRA